MRVVLALALTSFLAAAVSACSDSEPPANQADASIGEDAGEVVDSGVAPDNDGGVGQNDAAAPDTGVIDSCNPVLQSGCTPPASKCVIEPDQQNAGAHCVPRGNDVGLGEACMGEDCLPGLACVRTSSATAACVQVCDVMTGAGCEPLGAGYDCRTRVIGTNWGACSELPPTCDPLTQAPCPLDQACSTFVRRNDMREFRCREAGTATEGMPCGSSANGAQCIRTNVCVLDRDTSTAVCRKFCDSNDDCTAPNTCIGVVNDPPFQFCDQ